MSFTSEDDLKALQIKILHSTTEQVASSSMAGPMSGTAKGDAVKGKPMRNEILASDDTAGTKLISPESTASVGINPTTPATSVLSEAPIDPACEPKPATETLIYDKNNSGESAGIDDKTTDDMAGTKNSPVQVLSGKPAENTELPEDEIPAVIGKTVSKEEDIDAVFAALEGTLINDVSITQAGINGTSQEAVGTTPASQPAPSASSEGNVLSAVDTSGSGDENESATDEQFCQDCGDCTNCDLRNSVPYDEFYCIVRNEDNLVLSGDAKSGFIQAVEDGVTDFSNVEITCEPIYYTTRQYKGESYTAVTHCVSEDILNKYNSILNEMLEPFLRYNYEAYISIFNVIVIELRSDCIKRRTALKNVDDWEVGSDEIGQFAKASVLIKEFSADEIASKLGIAYNPDPTPPALSKSKKNKKNTKEVPTSTSDTTPTGVGSKAVLSDAISNKDTGSTLAGTPSEDLFATPGSNLEDAVAAFKVFIGENEKEAKAKAVKKPTAARKSSMAVNLDKYGILSIASNCNNALSDKKYTEFVDALNGFKRRKVIPAQTDFVRLVDGSIKQEFRYNGNYYSVFSKNGIRLFPLSAMAKPEYASKKLAAQVVHLMYTGGLHVNEADGELYAQALKSGQAVLCDKRSTGYGSDNETRTYTWDNDVQDAAFTVICNPMFNPRKKFDYYYEAS